MFRPSLITLIAITLVSLLLALVSLPGIACLIEGNSGYVTWELTRGWNNDNNTSLSDAFYDVYAWSLWRIGIGNFRISYVIYLTDELNLKLSKLPPVKG
jgi:hypothetical protein